MLLELVLWSLLAMLFCDSFHPYFFLQSTALTSDQSAEKLVGILKENAFISGSHVDYFD